MEELLENIINQIDKSINTKLIHNLKRYKYIDFDDEPLKCIMNKLDSWYGSGLD